MQVMLLIHSDEAAWATRPEEWQGRLMAA